MSRQQPVERERLPSERPSITKHFAISYAEDGSDGKLEAKRLKFYVTVGLYDDTRAGEVFIRGDKMGHLISGALDSLVMMMSVGLQYGVPLSVLTEKLRFARFGPAGSTGDPRFPRCSSMFDLLAQWLDYKFPNGRLRTAEDDRHDKETT